MSFGEILDSAFSLYRRHFVPLFTTTLIPFVPIALASGVLAQVSATPETAATGLTLAMIPIMLIGIVVSFVMYAALAREIGEGWTGREVSVGDGYRHGLRAFFPLVGAMILSYLLMGVLFGMAFIVAAIIGAIIGVIVAAGTGPAAVAIVMVPVVIMTVVASMFALAALFGVLPAIVIEKMGPIDAIGRSISLARGALPRVVGIVVVAGLIVTLPGLGALLLSGGFSAIANPEAVPSMGQLWFQQLLTSVVSALTTPFLVASIVILYFDRRVRTEALDVQMAADALAVG
jgi:hypothetical protein